jgi:hypothetical protein
MPCDERGSARVSHPSTLRILRARSKTLIVKSSYYQYVITRFTREIRLPAVAEHRVKSGIGQSRRAFGPAAGHTGLPSSPQLRE